MNSLNKTFLPIKSYKNRNWYLIDCKGQTLGRLSTLISGLLRGKNKPKSVGSNTDGEPMRIGKDGRSLKHDRYYGQTADLDDYDSVVPDFGVKKGVDTAKKYAANFVRDPAKTMANLRYKFKDLLQK